VAANAPVEVPQIARLEEECHNFLYEAKNFIRDLLQVVNHLYGTNFAEASEFFQGGKKGKQSLVEFADKTFGADDVKTKVLKEAVPWIEESVSMRNAVEHPDGYNGKLVIANFTLDADRKMVEPTWHREKDGKATGEPSFIRADMETRIHKLLTLGEDVFVMWASDRFQVQDIMRVAIIPEDKRTCASKQV
jgi:hypothetical protein